MRPTLACLVLFAAHGADAQMLSPPASMESMVRPGNFEEMCFELEAGSSMRYLFDADTALDFNVHWHRGSQVFYPVRSAAVDRRGGVVFSRDKEAYCLMWTNHGRAGVALRARIDRAD
jgi:hypothetical protein